MPALVQRGSHHYWSTVKYSKAQVSSTALNFISGLRCLHTWSSAAGLVHNKAARQNENHAAPRAKIAATMLDPLTALGLATAITQFVDFTSKILRTGYEISRNVADGTTADHVDLEELTASLFAFQRRLFASTTSTAQKSTEQQELEKLSTKCQDLAAELLHLLKDLRAKGSGLLRTWDNFRQAYRSVWKEKKIAKLEKMLDHISRQIDSRLIYMIWYANGTSSQDPIEQADFGK